jgi:cytochrome b
MKGTRIRVWDLPTRLFHWLVAAGVVVLWFTGRAGGDAMHWHAWTGYVVGTLLLFRLAWGFTGGYWSRFTSFRPSVRDAARYLRSGPSWGPGHNPLGAWSIYAMLALLLVQVVTGLGSETKEDFAGPWAGRLANATVHALTGYHKNIGQWILIGLVVLHLTAVAWHEARGHRIVGAMVHGDAQAQEGSPPSADDVRTRSVALLVLVLSAALVTLIVKLGG